MTQTPGDDRRGEDKKKKKKKKKKLKCLKWTDRSAVGGLTLVSQSAWGLLRSNCILLKRQQYEREREKERKPRDVTAF